VAETMVEGMMAVEETSKGKISLAISVDGYDDLRWFISCMQWAFATLPYPVIPPS
jgi:hypothetical protein